MAGALASTINDAIRSWEAGGKESCCQALRPHLINSENAQSREHLFDAFYVLVSSTTSLVEPPHPIPASSLATFIQSLAQSLPSTSTDTPVLDSPLVNTLSDVILDIMWTVDTELDDRHSETSNDDALKKDKQALADLLTLLLSHGILRPSVCRERLEFSLLSKADLIKEAAIQRKTPRVRTANLFKQRKFNLLRETNEGYSKLVVEISSLIGASHSTSTGRPVESRSSIQKRAQRAWEKIVGFIGYFDLDPNRVLDVLLDVFGANIAAHHSFFLELIRCSGWSRMRNSPESSQESAMILDGGPQYIRMPFKEVIEAAEKAAGGCPPETEAKGKDAPIISDILGFKFAYYQHPDTNEKTSEQLYLLAALLVREGFMNLADIYDHLTPLDADMPKTEKKEMSAANQRMKAPAKFNALASAAALTPADRADGQPPQILDLSKMDVKRPELKKPEPAKPELSKADASKNDAKRPPNTTPSVPAKDPPNQKLGFLKALLSLGALREAFWILSKFPYMAQASPDVADLLLRVMVVSFQPLSQKDTAASALSRYAASNERGRPMFSARSKAREVNSVLVVHAPEPPDSSSQRHVFFYPDWTARIPRCSQLEDLVYVLQPMMQICGPQISRDAGFVDRLCRMAKKHLVAISVKKEEERAMSQDEDERTREIWVDFVRFYLLPSLSITPVNLVVNSELWEILKTVELDRRWAMYDEWRRYYGGGVPSRKLPLLMYQSVETARETKDILRRLNSNTTGRMFSKPISRMTHSNPIIVFSTALKQALSYPNFATYLADALEYLTPLGFDVLTYFVLDILADPTREKIKPDGTSLEDWIHNLASFTGRMLRRHPEMDPELILQYVMHQLHANSSKEVLLLQEIISEMTSIQPLVELNETQIAAYAGGPILWIECLQQATRGSRSFALRQGNLDGTKRLIKSLTSGQQLALPLLITLAQYRSLCSYRVKDGEWHPKYLSSVFDDSHVVFFQYVELLSTALSAEEYAKLIPSLFVLCCQYGLEPAIAFHILRPVWDKTAHDWNWSEHARKKEVEMKEKARASRAKLDSSNPPSSANATPAPEQGAAVTPALYTPSEIWTPVLVPVIEDAKKVLSEKALETVGPHFFVTFWQMTLGDIFHPMNTFETNLRSLEVYARERGTEATYAERTIREGNRKLSDDTRIALVAEHRTSFQAFEMGRGRLQREKGEWFKHALKSSSFSSVQLVSEIVQHCIHPRLLLSPMDAEYSARMIKILHKIGTPGFSTAVCYDKVLGDQLSSIIFSCSDKEIVNYGRFLRVVLADLDVWHSSEAQYRKDNRNGSILVPGFIKRTNLLGRHHNVSEDDILSHTEVASFVNKLHKKILKSVLACFASNNYRPVKNAFLVLYDILKYFPLKRVIPFAGPHLEPAVKAFLNDERNDIKVLAIGYYNKFESVRADWAPDAPKPSKADADVKMEPVNSVSTPASAAPAAPANGLPPRPTMSNRPSATSRQPATNGTPGPSIPLPANPSLPRHSPLPPTPPSGPSGRQSDTTPRSEAVRRMNRPEPHPDSPKPTPVSNAEAAAQNSTETDTLKAEDTQPTKKEEPFHVLPKAPVPLPSSLPTAPRAPADSHLPNRPTDTRSDSTRNRRVDDSRATQEMPPPAAPSSKQAAQELRSSARNASAKDKAEDRTPRSPRRQSPAASRPGTRNPSADSRASDGRPRSERSGGGKEREERSSRKTGEQEGDRERQISGESTSSRRGRARDDDRERRSERERDRDRERDRERDRDRDRDREKGGRDRDRDRHRRDKDSTSNRKDRDRDLPAGPSSSRAGRRDDDGRNDGDHGRTREEASHKRRREDDDAGPSKRMRENGQEPSHLISDSAKDAISRDIRDDRRDSARDREDGRDPARRFSPNGRDRYRPDGEAPREAPRRQRDANGRDEPRGRERARREGIVADKDRERDVARESERDKDSRESERRDDSRKDDRSRRESGRDAERDKDRDRNEPFGRRDRKDRDAPERQGDKRDPADDAKTQNPPPALTSGPPSGPRAMTNPKVVLPNEGPANRGMRSDFMNGAPGPRTSRGGGASSLLNRIALTGQSGPSTRSSRSGPGGGANLPPSAPGNVDTSTPRGEQDPASPSVPTKRDSPSDTASHAAPKRVRINRNFAGGR